MRSQRLRKNKPSLSDTHLYLVRTNMKFQWKGCNGKG